MKRHLAVLLATALCSTGLVPSTAHANNLLPSTMLAHHHRHHHHHHHHHWY